MNPRHLAPKPLQDLFFVAVWTFPARSVPRNLLSGAHTSTVSARSGPRYGRICGHKQNRSRKPFVAAPGSGLELFVIVLQNRKEQHLFITLRLPNRCACQKYAATSFHRCRGRLLGRIHNSDALSNPQS